MDIAPLSPAQFSSPFTPTTSSLARIRRGMSGPGVPASGLRPTVDEQDGHATP
jgi:hypothetical protein